MKAFEILIVSGLALAVSGCGSTGLMHFTEASPSPTSPISTPIKLSELDRRLSELETMKPGLMRMVAIETDIQSLIGELSILADDYSGGPILKAVEEKDDEEGEFLSASTLLAMAEGDNVPKPVTAPIAPVKPSVQKPAPKFIAARAPSGCVLEGGTECHGTSKETSRFALHLASYKYMRYLERGWLELRDQFPTLLGGTVPRATRFTTDDGTVYIRLKAGPFETKQQAYDLCYKLKAGQAYCALSQFDGSALNGFVDL